MGMAVELGAVGVPLVVEGGGTTTWVPADKMYGSIVGLAARISAKVTPFFAAIVHRVSLFLTV
jgi:hypothetical protein